MEVVVLVMISIYLGLRLHMYRKQVDGLRKQIEFILENDTNMELTSLIPFKGMNALIISLNKLLRKRRREEYESKERELIFRKTITSVSHDLRTPLTSASGYIQMLTKKDIPEEKRLEYIETVLSRVNSVNGMLNQLFEFARIEANEYVLEQESVNVTNTICEVISMYYDDFTEKEIEPDICIPEKPVFTIGDSAALRRVFENIISNALKYGKRSIRIALKEAPDTIYIEISNETDIIMQGDVEHIFERFYTSDSSRSKKSTGLGLSIARSFIMRMGGTIEASLEGEVFSIRITMKRKLV